MLPHYSQPHALSCNTQSPQEQKNIDRTYKLRYVSCRISSQFFFFQTIVSGTDLIIIVVYELKGHSKVFC